VKSKAGTDTGSEATEATDRPGSDPASFGARVACVRVATRTPARELPGSRTRAGRHQRCDAPDRGRLAAAMLRRYPGRTAFPSKVRAPGEGELVDAEPDMREVELVEIRPDGPIRSDFLELHAPWIDRGLTRWLSLLDPGGRRPVVVVGAFAESGLALLGAVIGVWSQRPCERFDELLEAPNGADTMRGVTDRPLGGAWHLISVTTTDAIEVRNTGLARRLVGDILMLLGATGHAFVRTLSPALGLPELNAIWPFGTDDAVMHAARSDGRPVLQVMRLHLGGGATLERVLHASRGDDQASGGISLRFRYATRSAERLLQKQRWRSWIDARASRLTRIVDEHEGGPLYRADPSHDPLVCLRADGETTG